MALIDNDDQKALADSVRQLVAARSPLTKVRETAMGGEPFDRDVWQQLVGLGLAGLTIPEEYGGAGGTQADLAAALRELGYGLVPSPLLATTVLAANTLLLMDDESAKTELLPRIAAGEVIGALAVSERNGAGWIADTPATTATVHDGHALLNGVKQAVVNGAQADVLLVHARAGDRNGVFLVHAGAAGLVTTPEDDIDPLRATASVTFADTPAQELLGSADAVLDKVADLANIAVACEQAGAIRHALEITTAYANMRYSFGQPIGSYQGVKHKLADTYTEWCLIDAATRRAVEATDDDEPEAPAFATAARVLSSPAYVTAGKQMMMLHGGIGFTWEHDAHFFYKNAISQSVLFGSQSYQRARLADQLGI